MPYATFAWVTVQLYRGLFEKRLLLIASAQRRQARENPLFEMLVDHCDRFTGCRTIEVNEQHLTNQILAHSSKIESWDI